jgi:hypothetical protein
VERLEGASTPPLSLKILKKKANPRRHRQAALRRFLAMSATIGRNYAPNFDGAHPQGVQSDSLEGFSSIGAVQREEKPALRALFARAASAIILYAL